MQKSVLSDPVVGWVAARWVLLAKKYPVFSGSYTGRDLGLH